MQSNQSEQWQRLAEYYRQMSEIELEGLADQFEDLTELAQGVLRDELRTRGMELPDARTEAPQEAGTAAAFAGRKAQIHFENHQRWQSPGEEGVDDEASEVEFTWKTQLAEFDDLRLAWQLAEMLRRAGIDSWLDTPRSRYANDMSSTKLKVAADQLEAARQVAAQPVPQEIIDASMAPEEPEEFELPCCPACGAEDPVLEAVEPMNCWACEACGHEWQDELPAESE